MKISEITLYFVILFWFIFVSINVNPTLGEVYGLFTVGALLLYVLDDKKTILLDNDGKWWSAIAMAGGIYIAFTVLSSLAISYLQHINIGGVISLLGASTPALAESKILNFVTFSFPVAFIESMFWIRLADFFGTRMNIDASRKGLFTIKGWALILVLSFAFLMFHVTAKGITNNSALLLVFIMMIISLGTAFWFEEGKQAALFHIIANTIASAVLFGLFTLH